MISILANIVVNMLDKYWEQRLLGRAGGFDAAGLRCVGRQLVELVKDSRRLPRSHVPGIYGDARKYQSTSHTVFIHQ